MSSIVLSFGVGGMIVVVEATPINYRLSTNIQAVATTPPSPLTPADESPANTAVQNYLNTSAISPANSTIRNDLNKSLDETEKQPALSPECDSSPPAPLTQPAESLANTGLEEQPAPSPEPQSAVVSSPPPPVIPVDEPPVITTVQDELIMTEEPAKVDECCNTTTGRTCYSCRLVSKPSSPFTVANKTSLVMSSGTECHLLFQKSKRQR